jgi:hypothetical protein
MEYRGRVSRVGVDANQNVSSMRAPIRVALRAADAPPGWRTCCRLGCSANQGVIAARQVISKAFSALAVSAPAGA